MTTALRAKKNEIEGWVGLLGAFGFISGVGVLIYQLYLWLKLGEWVSMPLSTLLVWLGFDYSSITNIAWVGVQKLVVWCLDLPLSIAAIMLGFAIGYLVGFLVTSINEHGKKAVP